MDTITISFSDYERFCEEKADYARLRFRCASQRRELKRLNRKQQAMLAQLQLLQRMHLHCEYP